MCAERTKDTASLQVREFAAEDAVVAEEMLRESPEAAHWSVQAIEECLQLPGVSGLISERDGCAAGFILARRVVDEGEILNLAVRPEHRRRGDGSALVKRMIRNFRERGVARVFLEVRESNAGGIAFYEKKGFRRTGVRQSYYREPVEAAVLMEASTKEFTV